MERTTSFNSPKLKKTGNHETFHALLSWQDTALVIKLKGFTGYKADRADRVSVTELVLSFSTHCNTNEWSVKDRLTMFDCQMKARRISDHMDAGDGGL